MGTFSFRGNKYNSDTLERISGDGHIEIVKKELIEKTSSRSNTGLPVAIKVDGIYYLLQGVINDELDNHKLLCINKFILKKCLIEEPIKPSNSSMTFQQRWNAQNANEQNNASYRPY